MSSPHVIRKRCAVNIDSYCLFDPAAHGRQLSDPDHVQGDLNKVTIARVCCLICFKWVSKVSALWFRFFLTRYSWFWNPKLVPVCLRYDGGWDQKRFQNQEPFQQKKKEKQQPSESIAFIVCPTCIDYVAAVFAMSLLLNVVCIYIFEL